ncbi:hypothetical protein RFI_10107 [Reticulomyxa filosa]|uniref:Uncharacterized protein n=1 Tax=Reticulomyxa filosa TaxID=46433 RepID=X6NMW0_RETFI|nr:hypothetical protein RFI_10107 [Reticulomyxa filosa]|eukprot:ETO27029.1 hypothetical protein RFI_10107 [Reticulomyxa filosa]
MPSPSAIICHLCGGKRVFYFLNALILTTIHKGKYFKHSFPIHLKQCEKKWEKTHFPCNKCGQTIANHAWATHMEHCRITSVKKQDTLADTPIESKPIVSTKERGIKDKKTLDSKEDDTTLDNEENLQNANCQECETEQSQWKCLDCQQHLCNNCEITLHRKGARKDHRRVTLTDQQSNINVTASVSSTDNAEHNGNTENDNAGNEEKNESGDDYRVPCKICGRKFHSDRIDKHICICMKLNKKKMRKVWSGSDWRVSGTEFEKFKNRRSQTPEQVKKWRKHGRRWRQEREEFRKLIDIEKEAEISKPTNKLEKKNDITSSRKGANILGDKVTPNLKISGSANVMDARKGIATDKNKITSTFKSKIKSKNNKENVNPNISRSKAIGNEEIAGVRNKNVASENNDNSLTSNSIKASQKYLPKFPKTQNPEKKINNQISYPVTAYKGPISKIEPKVRKNLFAKFCFFACVRRRK